MLNSLNSTKSLIHITDLFQFKAVSDIKVSDLAELRKLGMVYFVYLFIYSGLEFTLTFLTHHVFSYNSMQQGWMFFVIGESCNSYKINCILIRLFIGLVMAIIQGGYVRRLPANKIRNTAITGLWIIIPSFISIGLASTNIMLYLGLFLFAVCK